MKVDNNYKIKIVGIGDFGIGVIKDFGERNLHNVEHLDMNTDWAFTTANKFVKIGQKLTKGFGSGGQVKFGKQAAEEDRELIIEAIKGCDILIVVAGLGGGTGSGASPVVVAIAKELKIPTIAFVTLPFEFEGKFRKNNAQYGLENLKNIADVLFTVSDEKFLTNNLDQKHTAIVELYKKIEEILKENILKVVDLFNSKESKNKSIQEILKDIECDKASYVEMFTQ